MATPYFAVTGQNPILVKTDEVQEVQIQPPASGPTFFDRLSPRRWVSPSSTNNNPWSFPSSAPPLHRRCQDLFWALLFYAHLFGIGYCTYVYSPRFMSDFRETTSYAQQMSYYNPHARRQLEQNFNDDDADLELDIDPHGLLIVLCIAAVMSLVFSTCALGFMMSHAELLVKVAVYFNVALFGCLFLLAMLVHAYGLAVIFMLLTAVMYYYTNRVWSRIPFAAANLVTAVSAVRANLGLAVYAYVSVVLVFLWSLWWSLASLSTIYVTSECQVNGNCDSEVNGVIMFAFLLSYYWTIQVLTNVVHCTTAGTVATWWHDPADANGCCSNAVRDSYLRSLTFSFGSICLASLIVAIVETIREILHSIRENGDGLIVCVVDCVISCIESFVELFNRFALIYCAVHGQSFLAAARSVMDLFRARGWTAIITDLMVDTCLSMMSIGVGLLAGLLCLIIAGALHSSGAMLLSGFGIGFLVGYAVCAVLFSVVSSAVNAVIVCYAEAPNEFQRNHLELSKQMRNAWRQAWPNDFSY